jgi:4-amino-4-deoxy-L-arabinose transferase-like glycosyltransferase
MSLPATRPWTGLLLVLLVLAVLAVRLVGLDSYPALHPDEGFWASGARNQVKFGDALMDGRLHPFLSPATFVALSGYFTLVEPTLASARLFSVGAGLLSCLLMWVLGRRYFPAHPWLLLLLYGLSGLAVLVQRTILLEAHQMFWLLLAATLWLAPGRGRTALAGVAYGVALLVKSNSLYLFPAFLVSAPGWGRDADGQAARSPCKSLALFLLTVGLVAGGGYATAWAVNPVALATAFRFELDGVHFLNDDVLFHVGRFGLHPQRALAAGKGLVLGEPFLVVLAAVGLLRLLRRPSAASRADRLFAAWAVCGGFFHFGQIYVQHRYLTTLAPAFAYLAARLLDPMPARSAAVRWRPVAALAILGVFTAFQLGRLADGIRRGSDHGYAQTVAWVSAHVPGNAKVLAAPYVGLSLPQRTYDFFRMLRPYGKEDAPRPLAAVVAQQQIGLLIVEDEWREFHDRDTATFLALRCRSRMTTGSFEVFEVSGLPPESWSRGDESPSRIQ